MQGNPEKENKDYYTVMAYSSYEYASQKQAVKGTPGTHKSISFMHVSGVF